MLSRRLPRILQGERERYQCQASSSQSSSADTALTSGNAVQVRVLCQGELRMLLATAEIHWACVTCGEDECLGVRKVAPTTVQYLIDCRALAQSA